MKWSPLTGHDIEDDVLRVTLRYQLLRDSSNGEDHSSENWELDSGSYPTGYDAATTSTNPSGDEIRIGGSFRSGEIYALQLNYETADGWVYSARDSFVWHSSRSPDDGDRVGTFPFFGHWAGGNYDYTVCGDTFYPSNQQSQWEDLIEHAFEQWERAFPDNSISVDHVPGDCEVSVDGLGLLMRPIGSDSPITIGLAMFNGNSEVYMVDDSNWSILDKAIAINENYLLYCALKLPENQRPGACVISPVYKDRSRGAGLTLPNGSVDVVVNRRVYELWVSEGVNIPGGDAIASDDDIRFNSCSPGMPSIENDAEFGIYSTMVHEAGHALGLSDFSILDVFDLDPVSHPNITDTVMNYDIAAGIGEDGEPDCSPHPMDIMAIHALYQSVNP